MQIACLRCRDFFDYDETEVAQFLRQRADLNYLEIFKKRAEKNSLGPIQFDAIIQCFCPYCREVIFVKPSLKGGSWADELTDAELKELGKIGGFQIENINIPSKTGLWSKKKDINTRIKLHNKRIKEERVCAKCGKVKLKENIRIENKLNYCQECWQICFGNKKNK